MPAGLKLSEEYGDAINVLFVEVQRASASKVEHFALQKKWLGTNAMWTTEPPLNVGLPGIPNFALLDAEGAVVLKGYSTRLHSEIEELIAAEVKAIAKGPKDLPKALKSAWKAFQKGDLAKGIAAAEKVATKGGDDAEAATDLARDFRAQASARVDRATWMTEHGYVIEADDLVDDLAKALKGEDELVARVHELRAVLDSDDMTVEMEAAKIFAKAEAMLHEDGLKARGIEKKFTKIAKKYEGTKTAKRAQHVLKVIKG